MDKLSLKDTLDQINIEESVVKKFDLLEQKNQELLSYSEKLNKLRKELERANIINSQYPEYKVVSTEIDLKYNEQKGLNEKIKKANVALEDATRKEIKANNELDAVIRELGALNDNLNKLPDFDEQLKQLRKKKNDLEDQFKNDKELIEKLKKELQRIDTQTQEINALLKDISFGKYPQLPPLQGSNTSKVLEKLNSKQDELTKVNEKIKNLGLRIQQQRELNTVIEDFIKQGLEIVNQNHKSNCPLCDQQFSSYEKLAEQITNNRALNGQLQALLQESSELNQQLTRIKEEIQENERIFIALYNSTLEKLLSEKNNLSNEIHLITKKLKANSEELERISEKISEINVDLDGLSVEEYEKKIKDLISDLIIRRKSLSTASDMAGLNVSSIKKEIIDLRNHFELISSEIDDLTKQEKYLKVKEWFLYNFPDKPIDKGDLTKLTLDLNDQIMKLSEEFFFLQELIEKLSGQLKSITKEKAMLRLKDLNTLKEKLIKKVNTYQYFLKSNLQLSINDLIEEEVKKQLNERGEELKEQIRNSRDLKIELEKLESYTGNLKEFLQSEKIKLEIKKHENDLRFLKKKVAPKLDSEKKKIIKHLENKIENFFHTDLINKLYNKIDPHPEFKKVEFKVNFGDNRPRLNICVTDSNQKTKLIPNLYFSTAQINILSLSIFLASALKSQEYDCIFIDDPIQSMDSINILSTIDLLRSLSVNFSKQIILSTHDENFHRILKKKLPPNIFKSKFLELETFGKVKDSSS